VTVRIGSFWLSVQPGDQEDPSVTRSEIYRQFLRLQESEARTIVLVTHDLREARKLARLRHGPPGAPINRKNVPNACKGVIETVSSPLLRFLTTGAAGQLRDGEVV
jgi:hypothetical protein